MKKRVSILLGALLLFASAFPLPAAAAVEVEAGYDWDRFRGENITLNIYNWGEYMSIGADGSMNVNAEFTELTGIRVNYTNFDTNEMLYSKLAGGGADYDVIIPSDYMIGRLIKEDMLAPLDFNNIPNYSMIGKEYTGWDYDPDNLYSVPYFWGYVGIIYNTTMVEEAPTSWSALWDERYAGQILMFDNSRDAFAIALRKLGLPLNPESIEQIDAAAAELRAQRPLVQAYVMDQIFDKMEGGEAALAPYYAGDAITMIDANPDLAFVVPEEGTNYFVDAACIPKNSANKEAAEMYINFLCETQVALANTQFVGYSTPQVEAAALLPDEIRNSEISYPPSDLLENNMWVFNVLPDELNAHMDKTWVEVRTADLQVTSDGQVVERGMGWLIPVLAGGAVVLIVVLYIMGRMKKKRNSY